MATAEQRGDQLVELYKQVRKCERCALHATRTQAVSEPGTPMPT